MNIYKNIAEAGGDTPLVRLNRIVPDGVELLCKLEFFNPTSSIKDRIAVNMIDEAEKKGLLLPGGIIVEPTSGNTGLGLAMVAAARNYRLIIIMPDNMSVERRKLMMHMGAELILTPGKDGMTGAVKKAESVLENNPGAYMPQQFTNSANSDIHRRTTAAEIWKDTDGKIDVFVAGAGTGGTLTGVGEALKEKNPAVEIIAVEPDSSAVLSGGDVGRHAIQGIGAGFVPEILNLDILDRIIRVTDEDAIETARKLASMEGILCGISSGANVWAALELARDGEYSGKCIVAVVCDTGERYLSTKLFK